MAIFLKRAYDAADANDGYRVLVDRLWPRGVSKARATLDDWLKDIAPTEGLRKGLHGGTVPWDDFYRDYMAELEGFQGNLQSLADKAVNEPVTLVFAAKDVAHNNAVVLQDYLEAIG